MSEHPAPPSVVVGIDGSRSAVRAALWAVDEAIARDIPLRLVAIVEPRPGAARDSQQDARDLAAAELAVRYAYAAIDSAGRPVKIETEIAYGHAAAILQSESNSAVMMCIGDYGLRHFDANRIGSTAKTLVSSAHCPVAIIRGNDGAKTATAGWIVAEVDETHDSTAVLAAAAEEARLRHGPMRVVSTWQSADQIELDRRLSYWKARYPDLDIEPVVVHGSPLTYLAAHAASIQLVVIGAHRIETAGEVLGPIAAANLRNADWATLVIDRQLVL